MQLPDLRGLPIAEQLRRYRTARGLTRQQLASRTAAVLASAEERSLHPAPPVADARGATRSARGKLLSSRATLSVSTIEKIETGVNRDPELTTRRVLARALDLPEPLYGGFIAAGTSEPVPATVPAPGNLGMPLSSFVGREEDARRLHALLRERRLITVTGPGGSGKTRLALEVARALRTSGDFPDGLWLVDLAGWGASADAAQPVDRRIAQTLGLREEPGRTVLESLVSFLSNRRLLLLLDNCEYVIQACAEVVTALLQGCAWLRVLVTSQQALRVEGEQRYPLAPLATPPLVVAPDPVVLGRFDAVRLFVTRAAEQDPSFALTTGNAPAVAAICTRLDGIPLALELAAAQIPSLGVRELAAGLERALPLLTEGLRTAPERQRTMHRALAWSYGLLSEPEAQVLRRLSVFAGGWFAAAATAVCVGDGVGPEAIPALLQGLADTSLVQTVAHEPPDGAVRYRLLETVRHYAREQLEAAAEAQAAQDRHLEWYVGLAEEGVAGLGGPDQLAWLNRLEIEHDNFRAALAWSVQAPSGAARAVQLVGALARFWSVRGHLSEGRAWCARALAMPGETPAPLRARALHGAGSLAHEQGSYRQARSLHEESLQLQRALGGARGIAASVANLGAIALFEGDYKRARALFEESLALQRDLDNTYGVAIMLNNLAEITKIQGDYAGAEALYDESLALHQGIENQLGIAMVLGNKADLARVRKEYDRSARLLAESLELRQRLGEQRLIADALLSLGQLALDQGDHSLAGIQLLKSLPIRQKIGDRRGTAYGLEGLAALAIATGDAAWAAHLAGAAMSIRDTINAPLLPYERPSHEQCLDRMRVALGDEQFTAAQAGGYRDGLDQIMAVVLAPAGADLEGAHSTAGAV